MSELMVGIDLGTTNSLVGGVVDGRVRLFADAEQRELLPSAVGLDARGALLVGRAARNRRLVDPAGTVLSIKRKMGQRVELPFGARRLSPSQISALILGTLCDWTEAALGERPRRALITVPAYFDDAQRQATRDAGALAGLSVERLLNEPTAAALNYQTGGEEEVLVYDLGGGTFDVSILERDEGFLEVRASRGDTQLGGDDLDLALTELLLKKLGAAGEQVRRDPRAMARLQDAAERAKIELSSRESTQLHDPYLAGEGAGAVHLDLVLAREELEQVAQPFVERTLRCLDDALKDAKLRARDLDRVILVGGASKMPLVAQMVAAHLGRPVQVDAEADRAVALGAARFAGRLAGAAIDEVLVDITPHTLAAGVMPPDGELDVPTSREDLYARPIIARDTVLPVRRSETFYTMIDDQPRVSFPVVQGESSRVGENTFLGEVVVRDLPRSPRGSPVSVSFTLDLSGILEVEAVHVPSGRSAAVTIAESPYRLSEQRREEAKAELEALWTEADEDEDADADADASEAPERPSEAALQRARALLARAERALAGVAPEQRGPVERAMGALSEALAAEDARVPGLAEALSDALLDLL